MVQASLHRRYGGTRWLFRSNNGEAELNIEPGFGLGIITVMRQSQRFINIKRLYDAYSDNA